MNLTINKIREMTTSELIEERRKYNKLEHEFILYVIDVELNGRLDTP